ncbi:SH3 domain-containing protein [Marivirga salinae]|uniref:SH3 domain-containing protein n=1 Tax=Marivirga salinarum TaxID=3059078 RepID=A0AA51NCJ9_9BACT|nr:SH3 domain-containing protein [Marivirga sp. BDSF4-3]WMN12784.1 SH3 domain-containing protein [Marivirga sp. BDSF4-3]
MKYLLIIIFLISNQQKSQDLVKGLILAGENFDVCCIYIPNSGLRIYDEPNGVSIGKLTLGSSDNNTEAYQSYIQIGSQRSDFDYSNLHMVGYEIMAIVYTDIIDDFVGIKNGYWLSITELKSKGLVLTTWMEYLINKDGVLGWYANEPGLNLRTEPNTGSEILATLKGTLWEITPINETRGLWCKVKVKEYREHPCMGEGDLIVRTITGWIKLLSDEQTPNVWNYSKGC